MFLPCSVVPLSRQTQPPISGLLQADDLATTPSTADGLDIETETDLRIWGCELIQHVGILLKHPQVVMACAQVLFQRFYYRKSMMAHSVKDVATACLFLAGKIEESHDRLMLRRLLTVVYHVTQSLSKAVQEGGKKLKLMDISTEIYRRSKDKAIKAERRILKELGFCVHIQHPHKLIFFLSMMTGLKGMGDAFFKQALQLAWNYMNDGLRTNLFVRYPTKTIACACIHLATLKLNVPMPEWWVYFGATTVDVETAGETIMALYTRPRRSYEVLSAEVQAIVDKKSRAERAEKAALAAAAAARLKAKKEAAAKDRIAKGAAAEETSSATRALQAKKSSPTNKVTAATLGVELRGAGAQRSGSPLVKKVQSATDLKDRLGSVSTDTTLKPLPLPARGPSRPVEATSRPTSRPADVAALKRPREGSTSSGGGSARPSPTKSRRSRSRSKSPKAKRRSRFDRKSPVRDDRDRRDSRRSRSRSPRRRQGSHRDRPRSRSPSRGGRNRGSGSPRGRRGRDR